MKPYAFDITKNPLKTRSDTAKSLVQMLDPLKDKIVMGGTGLHVGNHSTQYAPRVALFEGWSRLLWGIAPFTAGGFTWDGFPLHTEGFVNGPDPVSPNYWGDVHDMDQRMVELAAMSLALLLAPEQYWKPLTAEQKSRLVRWMLGINGKGMPENNWRFFRVLVNLALETLGQEFSQEQMTADLDFIDDLYVDDGWYRDNIPFDMYNPFAIHFYSLIYYAFKKDVDKVRCNRYQERVQEFAKQYRNFFHEDGSCVAYGRSLTYRFAVTSFFAACAFANIEALPWGEMKGIVLRNLRWWFSQPIFDSAGVLTVGYAYPSLYHSEQYNAPTSPYWAFKTYLILALNEKHPFWQAEELPLTTLEKTTLLPIPGFLFCRTDTDVVMLSAGQYPGFEANNAAAKYSKFAYSAKHGFSVSLASWALEKTGCDSMLMLCERDNYWRERRQVSDIVCTENCLRSKWKPWKDVDITTWLISCENWHVRIHHIVSERELNSAEGGFSIKYFNEHDLEPPVKQGSFIIPANPQAQSYAVELPWGITCIADLAGNRKASWIQPSPNTNLLYSTTLVPLLESLIPKGETVLACLVGTGDLSLCNTIPTVRLDFATKTCIVDGKTIALI